MTNPLVAIPALGIRIPIDIVTLFQRIVVWSIGFGFSIPKKALVIPVKAVKTLVSIPINLLNSGLSIPQKVVQLPFSLAKFGINIPIHLAGFGIKLPFKITGFGIKTATLPLRIGGKAIEKVAGVK